MTFRKVYQLNTTGYVIMQHIEYKYVYCWHGKIISYQYNMQYVEKGGTFGDNCEWRMTNFF